VWWGKAREPFGLGNDPVAAFWDWWLTAGAPQAARLVSGGRPGVLPEEIGRRVEAINPELSWEVGPRRVMAQVATSITVTYGREGGSFRPSSRWSQPRRLDQPIQQDEHGGQERSADDADHDRQGDAAVDEDAEQGLALVAQPRGAAVHAVTPTRIGWGGTARTFSSTGRGARDSAAAARACRTQCGDPLLDPDRLRSRPLVAHPSPEQYLRVDAAEHHARAEEGPAD
jgi:hypothetical protein